MVLPTNTVKDLDPLKLAVDKKCLLLLVRGQHDYSLAVLNNFLLRMHHELITALSTPPIILSYHEHPISLKSVFSNNFS